MDDNTMRERILNAFGHIFPRTPVEIRLVQEDTIYVYVGNTQYRIELPSDDDGYFYAYPWVGVDYLSYACIRIAYPA